MAWKRSGVRIPIAPLVSGPRFHDSGTNQGTTALRPFGCGAFVFCAVAEDVVHNARPAADGGDDHMPVDGLGDVRGLVAHGVADLLQRHAVTAHDRHGRVPT